MEMVLDRNQSVGEKKEEGKSMDKPIPYIGSKISLVSKSEIRYVGTLYNINIEDSTVALQNVKVYGTEGRRKGGLAQIPPNSQIFEYVIFKGSDIKDLDVYNPSKEEQQPEPAFQDPAIISSSVSTPAEPPKERVPAADKAPTVKPANGSQQIGEKEITSGAKADAGGDDGGARRRSQEDRGPVAHEVYGRQAQGGRDVGPRGSPARGHYQRQDNRQMSYNANGRRGRGGWYDNRGYNGRGNYRNYTNYAHMGHRPNTARIREDYSKEFDFHAMNEQFEKEKAMAKLSLNASQSAAGEDAEEADKDADLEAPKAYSKSSFFDSISCDITDRQEGNSKRSSKSMERQRNKETFGTTGGDNRYRRRGNHQYHYRGRGRGGYRYNGRGSRGRGRGFNSSYGNEPGQPRDDAVQPAS